MAKTIAIKVELAGATEQGKKLADLQKNILGLANKNKDLNKALRKGDDALKKLNLTRAEAIKQLALNNTKIKGYRTELLKTQQGILGIDSFTKKLGKSFSKLGTSIGGAFVGLFAIQGAIGIVKQVIDTVKEFEQQMARVKSITGATDEEFEKLVKSAKDLGSSSRKTAKEVGQLQEELAKLGFTSEEIIDSTAAIIQLSEATGSDLAQSASVAAGVLNSFGMTAKDSQEVIDVMAKSFTSSALDLNKFEVAMSNLGPTAAEAGFSIQQTTAMLGILADRNVQASKAGTGLRNVFLELSKQGITYEQAMSQINSATDRAAAAAELFGKENAVVATILADTGSEVSALANDLNNAEGAASDMADVAGDTLSGDLDRVTSAWEGFLLSLEDGKGPIAGTIRDLLDFTATALNLLSTLGKTREELMQAAYESKLPERIRQIREDEKRYQEENFKRIEESGKLLKQTDEQILDRKVSIVESERNLTNIQIERLKKELEAAGLSESIRGTKERQLKTEEERLKVQDDLIYKFKVEAGLQEDIEEIERKKRIAKAKALREEKERAELEKKNAKQRKKDESDAEREKERLRKQSENNLKKSLANTLKLEDEAEILSIENKREAEDRKLQLSRQRALEEVKDTENKNKEIAAINAKFDAEEEALKRERKTKDDEKEKTDKLELREKQLEFAQETANLLSEISTARVERQKSLEIDSLKAQLQQGLITQEQFDKQREEIERKAFEKQKKIDIATAIANGAIAITKTIAQLGGLGAITPLGAASLALVGAQTATQVGVIASQKFEDGGILSGPSHANGGIPFTVNGAGGFEAEGGEAIINKKSTAMFAPLLSAINQAGGGVSFAQPNISTGFFAKGGVVGSSSVDITGLRNEIAQAVTDSIKAIPVINNATDTISEASKVSNIVSDATFG